MYWRIRLALVFLATSLVFAKKSDLYSYIVKENKLDFCYLRPSYGKCRGHRTLWYYDIHRNRCEQFIYSNCGGNLNRFYNLDECESYCNEY